MNTAWINFLDEVNEVMLNFEKDGCDFPVFRGHNKSIWNLEPSLFRNKKLLGEDFERLESALYFDFVTYSAKLVKFSSSWECLFEMRHRGIPTRLLDWSENFGTALYFALSGNELINPCIWILNPYRLNEITYESPDLINPISGLDFNYEEGYLADSLPSATMIDANFFLPSTTPEADKRGPYDEPLAIVPPLTSDRLFAQKGLFTLQGVDETPIDLNPKFQECFVKKELPSEAINDARNFLLLAGINEFSIYPDLDGLSRYLLIKNGLKSN